MSTKNKKTIQIGIIGSMADQNISASVKRAANDIGIEIAKHKVTLLFGFENDFDSLPMIAARAAQQAGCMVIAFIKGKQRIDSKPFNFFQIITGQERGGGREFSLILSSDVVISLGGGSGTLMEMAMAYQADIPIISIKNSGGWSEKLSNQFLDSRKRLKIIQATDAQEAVAKAIEQGLKFKM